MSTGFETQTQNDERPVRGQTLQKGEVHENRGTGGGSENRGVREQQRLGLSQAGTTIENRSMAAGGTLRSTEVVGLVSLIQGCISRCPYEVPVEGEGVPKNRFISVTWFIWFGSWYTHG